MLNYDAQHWLAIIAQQPDLERVLGWIATIDHYNLHCSLTHSDIPVIEGLAQWASAQGYGYLAVELGRIIQAIEECETWKVREKC